MVDLPQVSHMELLIVTIVFTAVNLCLIIATGGIIYNWQDRFMGPVMKCEQPKWNSDGRSLRKDNKIPAPYTQYANFNFQQYPWLYSFFAGTGNSNWMDIFTVPITTTTTSTNTNGQILGNQGNGQGLGLGNLLNNVVTSTVQQNTGNQNPFTAILNGQGMSSHLIALANWMRSKTYVQQPVVLQQQPAQQIVQQQQPIQQVVQQTWTTWTQPVIQTGWTGAWATPVVTSTWTQPVVSTWGTQPVWNTWTQPAVSTTWNTWSAPAVSISTGWTAPAVSISTQWAQPVVSTSWYQPAATVTTWSQTPTAWAQPVSTTWTQPLVLPFTYNQQTWPTLEGIDKTLQDMLNQFMGEDWIVGNGGYTYGSIKDGAWSTCPYLKFPRWMQWQQPVVQQPIVQTQTNWIAQPAVSTTWVAQPVVTTTWVAQPVVSTTWVAQPSISVSTNWGTWRA